VSGSCCGGQLVRAEAELGKSLGGRRGEQLGVQRRHDPLNGRLHLGRRGHVSGWQANLASGDYQPGGGHERLEQGDVG